MNKILNSPITILGFILFIIMLIVAVVWTGSLLHGVANVSVNPVENNLDSGYEAPEFRFIDLSYVAVDDEDNLVVGEKDGSIIDLDISNKGWKNIKLDANQERFAVLGETKNNIYNLFVFDDGLYQATFFEASDVDNYFWLDEKTIYLVQGEVPDRWMHSYNIDSKELKKLFRVEGDYKAYDMGFDRHLFLETKSIFTTYSAGVEEFRIRTDLAAISNINYAATADEFIITDNGFTYFWDLNNPNLKDVSNRELGQYLCPLENSFIYLDKESGDVYEYKVENDVSIKLYNIGLSGETLLEQTDCGEQILFPIYNPINQNKLTWYVLGKQDFYQINSSRNITDIAILPNRN